ncbi:MAG: hypothetical protein CK532_04850 [Flavobacteriales bacterium]|nr:MAG: hypothetical protein CK532_04850 [Flavobacteriales bacterium]
MTKFESVRGRPQLPILALETIAILFLSVHQGNLRIPFGHGLGKIGDQPFNELKPLKFDFFV